MTIKNVICDIDGVLMHDNVAVPGAAEFLTGILEKGLPLVLLTNYPSQTGQDLANRFATAGVNVPDSVFYTSAMATADFLRRQEGKKAYVVGEGALIHELYKAGFTITDVNPDFVIVGETRSYNWDMMHKAAFFVANGARFIATNPDTHGRGFTRPAARCAQALKNFRPEAVLCRQTKPVDHPRGVKQNAGALGRDRYRRRQPAHRHSGRIPGWSGDHSGAFWRINDQ